MGQTQNKGDKQNSKSAQSNSKANKQNSQKLGKSNTKAAQKSSKKGNKLIGDVVFIIILFGFLYMFYTYVQGGGQVSFNSGGVLTGGE